LWRLCQRVECELGAFAAQADVAERGFGDAGRQFEAINEVGRGEQAVAGFPTEFLDACGGVDSVAEKDERVLTPRKVLQGAAGRWDARHARGFSVAPGHQIVSGAVLAEIAGFIRVFDRVTGGEAWQAAARREAGAGDCAGEALRGLLFQRLGLSLSARGRFRVQR